MHEIGTDAVIHDAPPDPARSRERRAEVEALGERIAELSAYIQAATYRLLVLLREFDERNGWNGGFRSCAHWLNWRTGLSLGAAREKVRVAHALAELPKLSGAMERGEVSYSKVRALTRIATPETEEELLILAKDGTAAHIEKIVRLWRRSRRLEELHREKKRFESRYLTAYTDEDGMVVVRARLAPEDGAALLRALEAARDRLYEKGKKERDGAGEVYPEQRKADALGLVAESALAGGLDPGTRGDRYQVVVHVDEATLAAESEEGGSALEAVGHGRVAPGSRPPGAPTDPDVRDSRIRLLGLRVRHGTVDAVDDARGRQGVVCQQPAKLLPVETGFARAAAEPFAPETLGLLAESAQSSRVARDPVVAVVPAQLAVQSRLLVGHAVVPMPPAPAAHPLERTAEAGGRRLAADDPAPLA